MTNGEKTPQEVLLGEIAGTLRGIKGWVTFLGIVVLLGLIGGCLVTVAGAFGGTASIVSSFKWPRWYVQSIGIDYHDGYLYHGDYRWQMIVKTTTTGSLVQMIPADYAGPGIDRTNNEFWTSNASTIFRLSTTGGFRRLIRTSTPVRGVAFGEGFLWFTGGDNRIHKITPKGSIVTSFRVSTVNPRGICYRNGELWIVDSNVGAIAHATTTGSLIDSYNVPQDPYGVTYERTYIWYSDLKSGWVYKMLPIPYGTAVEPASLGKVKALYR